jgi:murein L,D-transpeptidase YafK
MGPPGPEPVRVNEAVSSTAGASTANTDALREEQRRAEMQRRESERQMVERRKEAEAAERAELTAQLASLPPCSEPTQEEIMNAQENNTYGSIIDRQDNCTMHKRFKARLASTS